MRTRLAVLAVPVLLLAACSGGSGDTTEPASTSTAASPSVSTTPTTAEDADMEAEGEAGLETIPSGEWGHYSSKGLGFEKGEGDIDVMVEEWECDEDGQLDFAPEGKKICVFVMKIKNVGKAPYDADAPGAVHLEDGSIHDQSDEDLDASWEYTTEKSGTYVMHLNPGDEFTYYHWVSVPKDGKPKALAYPAESFVDGVHFVMELP